MADWDTDADYTAPPDRKGQGASMSGITNPFANGSNAAPAPSAAPIKVRRAHSFDRFGGGRTKCALCGKTVYVAEQRVVGGQTFHNDCFRCCHEGCRKLLNTDYCIQSSTGKAFCKPHFLQISKAAPSVAGKSDFSRRSSENLLAAADCGPISGAAQVVSAVANGPPQVTAAPPPAAAPLSAAAIAA